MKHTKEAIAPIVRDSTSLAQVLNKLNLKLAGGNYSHMGRIIRKYGLCTKHFTGKGTNRGPNHRGGNKPRALHEILILRSEDRPREKGHVLRRALLCSGVPNCCFACGIEPNWNGKPLCLVPDHKDGRFWDCRIENLRLLCPNCHSQTPTFSGRNNGSL
jgi:hypothetical protein